jgi:hypothetical protein
MFRAVRLTLIFVLLVCVLLACNGGKGSPNSSEYYDKRKHELSEGERFVFQIDTPFCDENGCRGRYAGVEFVDQEYQIKLNLTGTDIAHNYSNVISKYVGNQLKKLFLEKKYARVDFSRVKMTTKGMGDGDDYVEYRIVIPFKRVDRPEMATTGFDHCGGWGHPPAIRERVQALTNSPQKIVKNNKLWISPLFKTREGLEEYWIQWQHTSYQ